MGKSYRVKSEQEIKAEREELMKEEEVKAEQLDSSM